MPARLLPLTLPVVLALVSPARAQRVAAFADSVPTLAGAVPRVAGPAPGRATAPARELAPASTATAERAVEARDAVRFGPSEPPPVSPRRLWRSIGRGAVIGAAAGTLSSLALIVACGTWCDDNRGLVIGLHVGVGTAVGGTVGALVYNFRHHRERRP